MLVQSVKICTKCKTAKSVTEFSADRSRYDGLQAKCRSCDAEYRSSRVYVPHPRKLLVVTPEQLAERKERRRIKMLEHDQRPDVKERKRIQSRARRRTPEFRERINNRYHQRKSELGFLLAKRLRTRLYIAVQNEQKSGSAVRDLGCSVAEFKTYLESKFQPGMTWANWSPAGWHIDHIRPLASFDLTDRQQFLQACQYTNLQPLWARDNLTKGAREGI